MFSVITYGANLTPFIALFYVVADNKKFFFFTTPDSWRAPCKIMYYQKCLPIQLSQNEWYHPPPCDPNLLKSCLFFVHNCWRERKQIVQILWAATPFRKVTNWMTFFSWRETFPPACNIAYPTTIDTHCPNCNGKGFWIFLLCLRNRFRQVKTLFLI